MNKKYEIIEIDQAEITVDVSILTKTERLFFNATQIAKPIHHTNSNSKGDVATYCAQLAITSKVNVTVNIIDIPAAIMGSVYSSAWLNGRKMGVAR